MPYAKKTYIYCKKYCNKKSLRCNKFICENCSTTHDANLYNENSELDIIFLKPIMYKISYNVSIYSKSIILNLNIIDQFSKMNLCSKCTEEHFHCNCPELSDKKFINKEIDKNIENHLLKQLANLSEIFLYCYNIGNTNKKLTLNILFNATLEKNILSYIENE